MAKKSEDGREQTATVHFLVDYMVEGKQYRCDEVADIPAALAEQICDNSSVEYVAR